MARLPGRLGSLTAEDVMTKDVIVITETDTIDSAIDTLKQHHISGALVVDAAGKLTGIISVNDITRPVAEAPPEEHHPGQPQIPLVHGEDKVTWDLFDQAKPMEENAGAKLVKDRMSPRMTSVVKTAPLVEAARVMCEGHRHRVPVVEEDGALAGIISTMDVLAALVNTHDELE